MRTKLLFIAVLVAIASVASPALAKKRPPPPPVVVFDATGWELLGSQSVDGRKDRDAILVGKYQGRFDQLTVVVKDSDLDLKGLTIVFGNGEKWSPKVAHTFREGQRTRVIDLPGDNRVIARVELVYANKPGGGKASVEIYGRDTRSKPAPFDPKGWTLLGAQTVDGRRDKDTVRVGRFLGKFDQLTMVVADSDLELKDIKIGFASGQSWSPKVAHTFREGARTRVIDLPGKDRKITRVDLAYANLPGGGKARVEIYGRDTGRKPVPPVPPPQWDKKGWAKLGTAVADGWRDKDRVTVRTKKPKSELMFVVAGSDLEVFNIIVTFDNGETYAMPGRVTFKEGTRTAPIDLPGQQRNIKFIDFSYANLPGGGRAAIEVWARPRPVATPRPMPLPTPQPAPLPRPTPQPAPRPPAPPVQTPAPAQPPVIRDHR